MLPVANSESSEGYAPGSGLGPVGCCFLGVRFYHLKFRVTMEFCYIPCADKGNWYSGHDLGLAREA